MTIPTIENQMEKLGYGPETFWESVYEPVDAAMPDRRTPMPSKAAQQELGRIQSCPRIVSREINGPSKRRRLGATAGASVPPRGFKLQTRVR